MMDRRIALLPLLALAGTSLSGCVAAAIPALAGTALFGSGVTGKDDAAETGAEAEVASAPSPAPPPARVLTPVPVPTVIVQTNTATPEAPPPAPVLAPAPSPAQRSSPSPAFDVSKGPQIIATELPPTSVPIARAAPAPAAPPASAPEPAAYPSPASPLTSAQLGFARFVRYGQASALGARNGADLLSAILSDPLALDGKRRRCAVGEQPVALIDLDPVGAIFNPPSSPEKQPGLALGLAVLREAGVEIAWISDLSTTQSGVLRTALEQSGLDPRGEDIISLRRDEGDSKQKRKDNLAGITCIVAIAGDERPDFDERLKYLRTPAAGAALEPLLGDGWFLIEPLLGN